MKEVFEAMKHIGVLIIMTWIFVFIKGLDAIFKFMRFTGKYVNIVNEKSKDIYKQLLEFIKERA